MQKNLIITSCLILLFNFFIHSQLSLVFPKDEYVFDVTDVLFEWNIHPNANDYELQISTINDFSTLLINEINLTSTSFQSINLPVNQKLYWRVKADNSSWSSIQSFQDRKSTRLNSSHVRISYAVFCL